MLIDENGNLIKADPFHSNVKDSYEVKDEEGDKWIIETVCIEDMSVYDKMRIYCGLNHNDQAFISFIKKVGIVSTFAEARAILAEVQDHHDYLSDIGELNERKNRWGK